jgi:HlyD family secretion protein
VVLDVARRAVGSVVREAEPLITLVPSHAPLVAEVIVSSSDIGYAAPGDHVILKVDAFPYQRHGFIEGRLLSISEESFSPGSRGATASGEGAAMPSVGGAVHRARIALTNTKLENLPENAHLIPGMTLSAEIMVGKRSVISYFLHPITRGLGESMREP